MINQPLVSILMATYNRAEWLPKAIGSVLAQTYKNWELIIWNDGSTDNTREVLASYQDNRIRSYSCEINHGQAYSLNQMHRFVNGEYIAFLDDDDQWKPDKLSHQIRVMQEHQAIDLLFGDFENINLRDEIAGLNFNQNKQSTSNLVIENLEPGVFLIIGRFLESLIISNFIGSDTIVTRRNLLDSLFFNEVLRNSQDLELWWRLGLEGYNFAYVDQVLMTRIKPAESLSSPSEATYRNHISGLNSCIKHTQEHDRSDLLPLFRKPLRTSWQGLIKQYAMNGARKKAVNAFYRSCRYGIDVRSLYLLLSALAGPTIIKRIKRI